MDEQEVVVKQQDEIRVYRNGSGGISIAQENYIDGESLIWINLEHAEPLAQAILACYAKAMRGE